MDSSEEKSCEDCTYFLYRRDDVSESRAVCVRYPKEMDICDLTDVPFCEYWCGEWKLDE